MLDSRLELHLIRILPRKTSGKTRSGSLLRDRTQSRIAKFSFILSPEELDLRATEDAEDCASLGSGKGLPPLGKGSVDPSGT